MGTEKRRILIVEDEKNIAMLLSFNLGRAGFDTDVAEDGEIGLRKALGASSHAIGVEFYVESAVYGLLGGLLGTATGYGMARWLCATVFERSIGFNWWLAVVSVVFSALVAVVASIPPVHRATRIDPAVVLREE